MKIQTKSWEILLINLLKPSLPFQAQDLTEFIYSHAYLSTNFHVFHANLIFR